MNKTIEEERFYWIKPIINKELKYNEVLLTCPHSKRSLERWTSLYRQGGIEALKPKSTRPKTQPNETPIRIKERIIDKRKETKLCALKLHWRLEKEGLSVPRSTIAKILKDEGLVRKYRSNRVKYKYIKTKRLPGELFEIDVKFVPGKLKNKRYYQYTAIDTASRWRHLEIFDEQSSYNTIKFLKIVQNKFKYRIQAIKTDNHSTFTNRYFGNYKRSDLSIKTQHSLDIYCAKNKIIHYLIDPGKPAQNGTVERSHREDQQKFYELNTFKSLKDLKGKVIKWNEYYNNLEHCGLDGKTPNEVLSN